MILVTGATGLVGAHLLAKLLQSEQNLRALFRSESKLQATKKIFTYYFGENADRYFSKITWFKADISDIPALTEAFEGVSQVYHCAGLISFDPKDYHKLRKTNIEGTANVVNLCLEFKVEKLCHVSSIATLSKEPNNEAVTENSAFLHNGNSVYAITKYGAEMEVWRGSQEGLDVVIVNPGVIIGAGNWNSGSGLLFKKIDQGLNYHFSKTTGFVGVEDVVEIMIGLMNKPIKNERYVLIAENLSFITLFSEIAKRLGKPAPSKELKPWMVFIGWLFQYVKSSLFGTKRQITKKSYKTLFETTTYDASKIKKELGFEFRSIHSCVQKTGVVFLKGKRST